MNHPVDLRHLLLQGQDVIGVMEHAVQTDRPFRDMHGNRDLVETRMTVEYRLDVPDNLGVLDWQTRDHTDGVVELTYAWRPPDDMLVQHFLTVQRDGPSQDNFPLLYRHVHLCPLKALLLVDLGGKTRT